jgi:hypothetical protein
MLKSLVLVITATAVLVGALTSANNGPPKPAPQNSADYVGADACKKCHFKQHKSWKDMKHSRAWEVLSEEQRNPETKDDAGRVCISCHVTGWGEENGFVDPVTSEHLLGVQCEACHGPGSKHVELGQQMLKEKRKELAPGEQSWVVLKTTDCSNCHNPHVSHAEFK